MNELQIAPDPDIVVFLVCSLAGANHSRMFGIVRLVTWLVTDGSNGAILLNPTQGGLVREFLPDLAQHGRLSTAQWTNLLGL